MDRAEGKGVERRRFVRVPVGDSRDDAPPIHMRDKKGKNYYFQGEVNNCLMGGLANAVFWTCGQPVADELLAEFIALKANCWNSFVRHVNATVPKHCLAKISCLDVLLWDDSYPLVVQIRSNDMSESHAVCIYQGCIFDSASRFILIKSKEALTWCSGTYGFKCHLHLYQLQKTNVMLPNEMQKKKRSRH
jgi:hypothetical protein